MSEAFEGGCLCGAVRYKSEMAPALAGHCQCVDCRKNSGTGHGSHMGVPKDAVALTGEVTSFDKSADSGNVVTRCFCPTCGSSVYSYNSGMTDMVFLRASSLDDVDVFKPQFVVFTDSGAAWDALDPNLPTFPGMPPNM